MRSSRPDHYWRIGIGTSSDEQTADRSVLLAALAHQSIPFFEDLSDIVLSLSPKRCPKWKFRNAAELNEWLCQPETRPQVIELITRDLEQLAADIATSNFTEPERAYLIAKLRAAILSTGPKDA